MCDFDKVERLPKFCLFIIKFYLIFYLKNLRRVLTKNYNNIFDICTFYHLFFLLILRDLFNLKCKFRLWYVTFFLLFQLKMINL